ncbi:MULTISPECIES: fimbrial protein [Pseudomonas]|uniref:fimbrial protein n=1 Tax=Pseudomonas TaxID=286 RepID=UPI0023604ABE|nr:MULTISPECIES: fimbrial protein [Pseudomonas]WJV25505.1 fimbrial protein [Pseudomonas chlororaphis]
MLRLIILALGLLAAQSSYALTCLKNGNQDIEAAQVPTLALASTLPKNTIIWRSEPQTINIQCWHQGVADGEYLTLYLAPNDPTGTLLGSEIEAGIRLNGVDYRWSEANKKIVLYNLIPPCKNPAGCYSTALRVPLSFSVFLSKRSEAGPGKEGPVTGVPGGAYMVFQMSGHITPPPPPYIPGVSFGYGIIGMNAMRFVSCASTVEVSPRVIDFGPISSFGAQTNKVVKEESFSITSTKNCDSSYGLTGRFLPMKASIGADGTTLIPSNNNSLGIRLLKKENASAIPLARDFELVAKTANRVSVKDYTAELRWLSNTAKLGDFEAAVQLEVYYK